MSKESDIVSDCQILYFSCAWYTIDAAAVVVYFGPFFIFGMQITPSYRPKAVLIGFALNYAAYFAEIYRSGIAAIPVGQYEAARMLGYGKTQTFG